MAGVGVEQKMWRSTIGEHGETARGAVSKLTCVVCRVTVRGDMRQKTA